MSWEYELENYKILMKEIEYIAGKWFSVHKIEEFIVSYIAYITHSDLCSHVIPTRIPSSFFFDSNSFFI